MANNKEIQQKVNNYLGLDVPYTGETKVLHYLEVLRDVVGFDNLKAKVTNSLKGRKIAAYYGCLLLRPGQVMSFDDVERPVILEDFIKALGAEPVIYDMRNECCAGYMAVTDKSSCQQMVGEIQGSAANAGAGEFITACPLCAYNLVANAGNDKLPVSYFTEVLAEALGLNEGGAD
jgi:heterodisulfide reductase subunit B